MESEAVPVPATAVGVSCDTLSALRFVAIASQMQTGRRLIVGAPLPLRGQRSGGGCGSPSGSGGLSFSMRTATGTNKRCALWGAVPSLRTQSRSSSGQRAWPAELFVNMCTPLEMVRGSDLCLATYSLAGFASEQSVHYG